MWDGTAPLVLSLYGLYGALAQLIRALTLQSYPFKIIQSFTIWGVSSVG